MRLTMASTRNPRLGPLLDGTVTIDGANLDVEVGNPAQLHLRILTENCFDVFEFSLAGYFAHLDRPVDGRRWKALPIFYNRSLLILGLHTHRRAGIGVLGDLKGKRVGIPDFGMTAAIWLRIMLRRDHGVEPEDVVWVNGRSPDQRHTRLLGYDEAPVGVTVESVPEGRTMNDMLHAGELDAAFGDRATAQLTAGSDVSPLFAAAEGRRLFTDFWSRHGALPTSHVLVTQEILSNEVVQAVARACERSKHESYQRAKKASSAYLLFPDDDFAYQAGVFGRDPYPIGFGPNRRMLELLASEMYDEGLLNEIRDLPASFHSVP